MSKYHHKPKILIVDDQPANLYSMKKALENLSIEIIEAESGQDALLKMMQHEFGLVILDVQMPEMDGFETASLMLNNRETREIPVIFVTAVNRDRHHIYKGYETGAVDYLFKPVDPDILISKVSAFIRLDAKKRELKNALKEVKRLARYNALLLDNAGEGIIGIDLEGFITFANPAAAKILRCTRDQLPGKSFISFLYNRNPSDLTPKWEESDIYASQINKTTGYIENGKFWLGKSTFIPVEYTYAPITDHSPEYSGCVILFQDITRRKKAEKVLMKLANYDPLTGLANRSLFSNFQHRALARARRTKKLMAILFIDLDHFKEVNDTLGHDMGDLLLKKVANRLAGCIRATDLVARMGGDEFAVILDGIDSPEDAGNIAQKIIDTLSSHHNLKENKIYIGSSIGIAVYPDAGKSQETLNKAADIAMYHAKQSGRNNFQFFAPQMQIQATERMQLENDMRQDIENTKFSVFFQPKVDIKKGAVSGMEALLRWPHDKHGLIMPDKFIPIAEKSGLISSLGGWVLKSACEKSSQWNNNPDLPFAVPIAVNVSLKQLIDDSFRKSVDYALQITGLPPEFLEIELTESTVMDDPDKTIHLIKKIRELGVRISIDDFGTGYSSLSYLRRLPIDAVKIDKSFVQYIGKDSGNESIIKAIIALSSSLGIGVIAEGVETKEQADFLNIESCHIMQGYHFSKPLNTADAEAYLASQVVL